MNFNVHQSDVLCLIAVDGIHNLLVIWLGFGDCSGRNWSGQPQHRHQRRSGGVGAAETTSYVAEMSLGRVFRGTVALDQC